MKTTMQIIAGLSGWIVAALFVALVLAVLG
jgi:hypothetical protein